ncbi:unnamed protein product [Anisakis simplex]|uniref:EF-hand domain-containing protein n=1 Tax=Anisakis simplex TaxID=6269 RepID=A0A0M3KE69_ANISI|nr:unnamed protein product [Anisakis simplex]
MYVLVDGDDIGSQYENNYDQDSESSEYLTNEHYATVEDTLGNNYDLRDYYFPKVEDRDGDAKIDLLKLFQMVNSYNNSTDDTFEWDDFAQFNFTTLLRSSEEDVSFGHFFPIVF